MTRSPRSSALLLRCALLGAALLPSASAEAQLGRVLDRPSGSRPPVTEAAPDPWAMPDGWSFDITAQTSLPVSIGFEAQLQTPIGIFVTAGAGHTPNAYLSLLGDAVQSSGAFGDDVRPLIDEVIANGGWNMRVGLGLNPFEGLELSVGYTHLSARSVVSPRSVERAAGQRFPFREMSEVPIDVDVHALHGRVGYRFLIEDRLLIRAALGWTHTVAMGARFDVPAAARAMRDDALNEIEKGIAGGSAQYGFTPELIVSIGVRH